MSNSRATQIAVRIAAHGRQRDAHRESFRVACELFPGISSPFSIAIFSLSIHASYRCRHAGACCTSGWPIPVEADRLAVLRAALATGALKSPRGMGDVPLFTSPDDAPADTPVLLGVQDHVCVFFDAEHGRLCTVQRALGHDALPLACRQFPRVSLRDPRGVSVTLSHYCPTAASLLGSPRSVTIVRDAPAFPEGAEYSGLDATTALPPLLRPDVLMDWESWWLWESSIVDLIGNADGSPEEALARLDAAVDDVARWRPDDGPLDTRVRDAVSRARSRPAGDWRPSAEWLPRAGAWRSMRFRTICAARSPVPPPGHRRPIRYS